MIKIRPEWVRESTLSNSCSDCCYNLVVYNISDDTIRCVLCKAECKRIDIDGEIYLRMCAEYADRRNEAQ